MLCKCPAISTWRFVLALLAAFTLSACLGQARYRVAAGSGPDPVLPTPKDRLIPVFDIAPAQRWPPGRTPLAANGLAVNAFASGLDHPRWLHVLPNGDVLVAEAQAPEESGLPGLKGKLMGLVQKITGSNLPSADRITLLRDTDGDGIADVRSALLEQLHSPFGMTLVGDSLYVANTDAVVRFPYRRGVLRIEAPGEQVAELPAGPINRHWTRNVVADASGQRLFVTVGSNSNIAEYGMEQEIGRAAVHELDLQTGEMHLFASGLRNPNGLAFEPVTGALWVSVNERDELGSDLVPDYMTPLERGQFYGWPYSYFGQHVDPRVHPQRPELVAAAVEPAFALGPHTSSMGLVFYRGNLLPQHYRGGAFVSQRGSWNRRPPSGYRVVFVPFAAGRPVGLPQEVLTGFLDSDGGALGRPVGLEVAADGALLVADDVGNTVWRIAPARQGRAGP
ncbi:MAG: sorbosone dehydrogenase family protein [Proteobacteria bacterium]|nr:sorbosone dehydrogenase family protein [Pseudomonadota bacterium]